MSHPFLWYNHLGGDTLLDKKSYKLLKKLHKVEFLTYSQIDSLLGTNTPESSLNPYSQNLIRNKLIDQHYIGTDKNGDYEFDGYQINLDGDAYVEEQQHKFWNFLLPYAITTFIAVSSLFVTILTNYENFVDALSKIAQIVH